MTFNQFLESINVAVVQDENGTWKAARKNGKGKTVKRKEDGKLYEGYRSYTACWCDLEDDLVKAGVLTVAP